jgi:hypothetical protein
VLEREGYTVRGEGWGERDRAEAERGEVEAGGEEREDMYLDSDQEYFYGSYDKDIYDEFYLNAEEAEDEVDEKAMAGDVVVEEEMSRDWEEELDAYASPGWRGVKYVVTENRLIPFFARHDLGRMDRCRWWGEGQFCPADRHPDSVNLELERRWLQWREAGRRGALPSGTGLVRCLATPAPSPGRSPEGFPPSRTSSRMRDTTGD